MSALVQKIPNAKPIEDVTKGQVYEFLKKIKPILEKQKEVDSTNQNNALVEDTQVAKLFEEIKIMFQDLPSRIDRNVYSESVKRNRKRFHPMFFEEMIHTSEDESLGFLMALSFFKEDMPWGYEIGIETLNKIKNSKSIKERDKAVINFSRIIDISTHNPYYEETIMRDKENYRIFRELPHILDKALRKISQQDKQNN